MVIQIGKGNFIFLTFLFSSFLVSVFADYDCEYKKDGFYSDEDFCHIYWRCNYGVPEEYECPAGTAWNHIEMRCDWLDNVDCSRIDANEKDDDKSEETTKKRRKKTTTTSEDEYDETTTPADDAEKPNEPPATSSICVNPGVYSVQDNSDCSSYFMCNSGKESKMSCGDKQYFNSESSQCEDWQQVGCGTRPASLNADKSQCTGKRDGIYPDNERGCRVFYQCVTQAKTREAVCPNNLKFNSVSAKCDNPSNILAPCGTFTAGTEKLSFNLKLFVTALVIIANIIF